jgi:ligand-binding sensor protein
MMDKVTNILDLVSKDKLQKFSDAFAQKNKIACVILDTSGTPITTPSGMCKLCTLIRSTTVGDHDCVVHGKNIADEVIKTGDYAVMTCVRSGFADASAPLIIQGEHIASWNIGQANIQEGTDEEGIRRYAGKIGIDPDKLVEAWKEKQHETHHMTTEHFKKIIEDLLRYSKLIVSSAEVNYISILDELK